jgi:hypothetical protein
MWERIAASFSSEARTGEGVPGGEELREVLQRDAEGVHGAEQVVRVLAVVARLRQRVHHR